MELNQQNKTDLLEIVIILALVFLVVVIYLPVAIWEDEEHYQNESRYRMQNLYDVESFYSRLTGEYNPNFFEALSVVNAIRDSALADSLFIGEQLLNFSGKEFIVDVDESFGFDYDTTFGIKSFRKDTVKDTTLQIVVFSEELGRNDTSFIRKKDLWNYEDSDQFLGIVKEEPIERVEALEFYKTNIPDSSTYYCPYTNNEYVMEISEDGADLMVASPIKDPIVVRHYLIFSFKAINHGVIRSGRRSWD